MAGAVDTLRSTSLFGGLSDDELRGVAGQLREQRFLPGEMIISEGARDEAGMWIILEGQAEVRKGGTRVHLFRPGDYFGEMALLSDPVAPRSADVAALGTLVAAEFRKEDLMILLTESPGAGVSMLAELARRLRRTTRRLEETRRNEDRPRSRSLIEEDDYFGSIARGAISPPISQFGPTEAED